jgi:DNA-binding NtrC family response regulator
MLAAAIDACDGNLTAAAERLGLTFRQIRYKVRQLGMR